MAFQKILVALDCSSPEAENVFQQAIKLAKSEGSHLMLFHCISWENEEKINPLVGIGALGNVNLHTTLKQFCQQRWTEQIEQVRDRLHTFYEQAKSEGVSVEYKYQAGNPSASICEQAYNWGADLVMIGRRSRMKWSELLLKSVSSYVLHHASCSVFVIQTGISYPENISVSNAQAIWN
ncbi:universal stress protein [Capilliphycus salinus ALCB114379]|uniref:universal stress protein n=1 Tax=Capilliphycus salinus TaxID=2768948 RepID=UPI0039A632E2